MTLIKIFEKICSLVIADRPSCCCFSVLSFNFVASSPASPPFTSFFFCFSISLFALPPLFLIFSSVNIYAHFEICRLQEVKETSSPFVHLLPIRMDTWLGEYLFALYNMRTIPIFNSKKSTYISVCIYIIVINYSYPKKNKQTNYVNCTIVIFFFNV